jgi:hypothetical protein
MTIKSREQDKQGMQHAWEDEKCIKAERNRRPEGPGIGEMILTKLRKQNRGRALESSGLSQTRMAAIAYQKERQISEQLSDYYLLKKTSTPQSY